MKRLVVSAAIVCGLLYVSGCHNTAVKNAAGAAAKNSGVDVVVEGGGQFPQFLVGRWKADKGGWELVFAPDGTISSAVIAFGQETVRPGRVTQVKMKQGGKGIFEPGQWMAYYNPGNRDLMVKIVFSHIHTELGGGVIEGRSTDILDGTVFNDGKTWAAEWTSFPSLVVHTKEHPNLDLSPDPNEGEPKGIIVFNKVSSGK